MKLGVKASDFNAFGCPPGNGTGHCCVDAIIGLQEATMFILHGGYTNLTTVH